MLPWDWVFSAARQVFLIGYFALPDIPTDTFIGAFLSSFINAAIPEEGLKFAALYFLAKRCKHFDEMFDGIVYTVCIGMGFAGLENILYLFGADDEWISVGISRALLSVPMHYIFAINCHSRNYSEFPHCQIQRGHAVTERHVPSVFNSLE